jgi:hypothetical protein
VYRIPPKPCVVSHGIGVSFPTVPCIESHHAIPRYRPDPRGFVHRFPPCRLHPLNKTVFQIPRSRLRGSTASCGENPGESASNFKSIKQHILRRGARGLRPSPNSRLSDWSANMLTSKQTDLAVGLLSSWPVGQPVSGQTNPPSGWPTGWQAGHPTNRQTSGSADRPTCLLVGHSTIQPANQVALLLDDPFVCYQVGGKV